jgi:hypothetical protein
LLGTIFAQAQSYFENFDDGVANGWQFDQGVWQVQNNVLFGEGRLVGNRVNNVGYVSTFSGANMSVRARLHTDDFRADDVSRALVLRYKDASNFIWVTWRAGWRQDITVEQRANGVRSYVVPEFENPIPPNGQTEWRDCRVDIMGNQIVAWFDGQVVLDKEVAGLISGSGSPGTQTFGSNGGLEQIFCDDFVARMADLSGPNNYQILTGQYVSGDLNSLNGTYGNYLVVGNGLRANPQSPFVRLESTIPVPFASPNELILRIRSQTTVPNLLQVVELMNWNSGLYETVSTQLTTVTDKDIRADIVSDPGRFVNSVTGSAQARISYSQAGPLASANFRVKID